MGYGTMEEGLKDWQDGTLGAVLEEDRLLLRAAYDSLKQVGDRRQRIPCRLEGRFCPLDGRNQHDRWLHSRRGAILQRTVVDITQRKA